MKLRVTLLMIVLALLAAPHAAVGQKTYTWTLIEGPGAFELWPNQLHGPNLFEASQGLLGRIVPTAVLSPGDDAFTVNLSNECSLAPSYPCQAGSPPSFLLPVGSTEPNGPPADSECNRKVIGCNSIPIDYPYTLHGGHPASPPGEYSFLFLRTSSIGTVASGGGVSFFSGQYTTVQQPYVCNDCPPTGLGKDISNQIALDNTGAGSETHTADVSLWITQASAPFGHTSLRLASGGAGPGKLSVCGNGEVFQTLDVDLCIDGTEPTGNFQVVDQKLLVETYSVDPTTWASRYNPEHCNSPGCYIEHVIIPAALAQAPGACGAGGACAVQRQVATTVLPPDSPGALSEATVDVLLFALTTQPLDMDGDGTEDRNDPCPNDPTDFCRSDLIGGGSCPTGQVFCQGVDGSASCMDGALCNTRNDVDQSCNLRPTDVNKVGVTPWFNSIDIGPFGP